MSTGEDAAAEYRQEAAAARQHTGWCQCDTVPAPRPSSWDSYEQAEQRVPNPLCPVHRDIDDMDPYDYDQADTLDLYGVAWSEDRAEWVEADDIDEETGEPYTEGSDS